MSEAPDAAPGAGDDQPPVTGDPRVDAAVERLADLDAASVHEHAEIYADVHGRLIAALGDQG